MNRSRITSAAAGAVMLLAAVVGATGAIAAPADVPASVATAAQPFTTVSQENAKEKALDYLAFTAFSRIGLIKQLMFEGFNRADATYGVDATHTNWYKQAALKAQEYLDFSAFSRKGLIDQLKYEGFTTRQAMYGAKAVGL